MDRAAPAGGGLIATLQIRGIGPIVQPVTLEPDPAGPSTVVGPSAAGKSTLIDALCFLLWGLDRTGRPFPAESISGEDACVQLVTARGNRIVRTMTPARRTRRVFHRVGAEPDEYDLEAPFRRALGPFGENVDALLLVVSPEAWVPLALGEGGGRPLRDVLASAGPQTPLRDRIAALMEARGAKLLDRDQAAQLTEKGAEAARATANRRRDEANGSLKAVRERLAAAEAPAATGPTEEQVKAARAVLEAVETWRAYLAAKAAAESARAVREDATTRREAWLKRRDALPPEPERVPTRAELDEARAALDAAQQDAELDDAEAKVRHYEEEIRKAEQLGENCPTCARPWPGKPADSVAMARAALKSATAYRDALGAREQRRAKRAAGPVERLAALTALVDASVARNAALAALGPEPVVPPEVQLPLEPAVARPVNAKAAAEATIAEADRAKGAADERYRTIEEAKRNLETAQLAAQAAEEEAARLDALVAAVRAAPSQIAEESIAFLGPIAPLSLELEPAGGVRVRIDRWDFQRASTGRRIAGDLAFRAGLRRALGVPTLPIFVDAVQSVGCELPEVDGPVIYLRTDARAAALLVDRRGDYGGGS